MARWGKSSLLLALLFSIIPTMAFAANGYGTSSIALTQSTVNVALGGAATVGYTVNLASGNTWGTNFVVVNQSQLEQKGIDLSPSVNSGEPPYSGTLSIQLSQYAMAGTYTAVLAATGDDPSASNVTLTIVVSSATPATTTPSVTAVSSSSSGYSYSSEICDRSDSDSSCSTCNNIDNWWCIGSYEKNNARQIHNIGSDPNIDRYGSLALR